MQWKMMETLQTPMADPMAWLELAAAFGNRHQCLRFQISQAVRAHRQRLEHPFCFFPSALLNSKAGAAQSHVRLLCHAWDSFYGMPSVQLRNNPSFSVVAFSAFTGILTSLHFKTSYFPAVL